MNKIPRGEKMSYSERELLARIIQCEAGGEGDNGMKAVASVVMNRVNVPYGEYARISQDGSIRNIIFHENLIFTLKYHFSFCLVLIRVIYCYI